MTELALRPAAQPPSQPVRGPGAPLESGKRLIVRAMELDDATLEELARGNVEGAQPQMKLQLLGIAGGVIVSVGTAWAGLAGLLPLGIVPFANVPLVAVTILGIWRQRQQQKQEGEMLGVSHALLKRLWWKQLALLRQPGVMRESLNDFPALLGRDARKLEVAMKWLRRARDELAQEEQALRR